MIGVLDGDDVGARHHDVFDGELAEAENVAEHAALLRAEGVAAGLLAAGKRILDHLAQIGLLAEAEAGEQALEPGRLLVGRRIAGCRKLVVGERGVAHGDHLRGRRLRILGIGVGDAERGEDLRLERFHALSVRVALMVEARADAACRARRDGRRDRRPGCPFELRFLDHRLAGKHDVAERDGLAMGFAERLSGRKRQHVGGRVLAAPGAVQLAHLIVVGEHERDFARLAPGAAKTRRRRRAPRADSASSLTSMPSQRPRSGARFRFRASEVSLERLGPPSAMALTLLGRRLIGVDDLADQLAANHVAAGEGDMVDVLDAFENGDGLDQARSPCRRAGRPGSDRR